MSEKVTSEAISRRRALLMALAAPLSLAIPPTVLLGSDAQSAQPAADPQIIRQAAQRTAPPQTFAQAAPQTTTQTAPQTGTERRQERRTARTERRQDRRTARAERRQERRTARTERRTGRAQQSKDQRTGAEEKKQ